MIITDLPDNTDDIIDSRDIIEAIEALQDDDTMIDELAALEALAEEAEEYSSDWQYGEALIRDSYFQDYAQDLAFDIGYKEPESWPYDCIDWEMAATGLQMDYTSVDFDGVTYWIRSC